MYRPSSVKNRELMTLYEGDGEECLDQNEDPISEVSLENLTTSIFQEDLEASEEEKGAKSCRSSLSLEIYGLRREQQVHFSNQEYYARLEELKRTHLRNMADLEKMYISQERVLEEEHGGGDDRRDGLVFSLGPSRKLQRINSQEELDLHETSSSSDYSEPDVARRTYQEQTSGRDYTPSPEDMMFRPRRTSQKNPGTLSRQTLVRVGPGSRVTVPKPFQMMLREEQRKRHKRITFLERERRKKEAKVAAELGRLGAREERQVFKARPIPRSVYTARHRSKSTSRQPKFLNICMLEREVTEGHSDPNSDPEQDSCPQLCRPQKCVKKKQLEVSIELVRGRERSPGGDTPLQSSAV
ncbi:unnamed protein product [Tetraodon nigroviridis]|uniref:(spotted green pufferfish) hypothetical protein n=1 Tax=Tetraodon nigroviridis TaxID=99883 RepID=Q4SGB6_TETNG|nr:unnamed protein product [Tetraodon nigroviridis]